MAKQLLGKEVTAAMNERLQQRVAALKEKGVTPKLAIVRCGADHSDLAYEKGAEKRAALIGVEVQEFLLPEDVTKEALLAQIDAINAEIREKLYPFDSMRITDKRTVDDIVRRYTALSSYDRQKIERYEDVVKTKTQIDNTLRGIVIAAVLCVLAGVITVLLIRHIRIRRRKKEADMEALAALYRDE